MIDAQDYDTAVANAQKSKAAAEAAQVTLDYAYVKSPIDGRVGIRLVDLGNVVHAADTTGIVVITQLKPISVMFTLPEQSLQSILNQGSDIHSLTVSALSRGNTTPLDQGTLAVVDNEIDQTTGTVKLKATFPNEQLKLWPGEFVNARLVLTTRRDATVAPSSVVQRGPQGTYAYVIKTDKSVEMRTIKTGQTENNETIIEDGLKPGEQVVVDGQYKLQPGSHVVITAPQGATPAPSQPGHRQVLLNREKAAITETRAVRRSHECGFSHFRFSIFDWRLPACERGLESWFQCPLCDFALSAFHSFSFSAVNISEPFIRRPVATSLLMAGVVLLGMLGYRLLPISALPTVDFPTIEVVDLLSRGEPRRHGFVGNDAAGKAVRPDSADWLR